MAKSTGICRECGNQFTFSAGVGRPPKYCSDGCRRARAAARNRMEAKPSRDAGTPTASMLVVCEGCGSCGGRTTKGLCRDCSVRQVSISRGVRQRKRKGRLDLPPKIVDVRLPRTIQCAECGCARRYVPQFGVVDGDYKFCSKRCRKRASDRVRTRMRRAATRSAHVEPVDHNVVFDRDCWRCGLCGRLTIKTKRGTQHEKAPVVDHIVPLSKGGEHTYKNVQCACHACNSAKGASIVGQLRLFG